MLIKSIIGEPSLDENTTLGEQLIMRKTGLPIRNRGPLLQYSLNELQTMEACEMRYLADWLKSIRKVLISVAEEPMKKISFKLQDYRDSGCQLSEKGKKIKKMVLEPPSLLGPGNEYSYLHSLYGEQIYWLPVDFLP
ncbi:hypothetical protein QUF61_15400 [Candidatus Venteria ishoeyi]|uniref:hypothetical protein n=1 Tax=Candidatus Venteria ishoeyi TaxID=1899563 RepID=UPI0025A5C868|nr:hypothetical protein [Candidatus Venteria ishoeyi]MDM8547873.1 hypothetical protein [Candidatus Venteria ishoeyi]